MLFYLPLADYYREYNNLVLPTKLKSFQMAFKNTISFHNHLWGLILYIELMEIKLFNTSILFFSILFCQQILEPSQ